MRLLGYILAFWLASYNGIAQINGGLRANKLTKSADSAFNKFSKASPDTLKPITNLHNFQDSLLSLRKADSLADLTRLQMRFTKKLDSLKLAGNFERWRDSLKVTQWGDSLKKNVKIKLEKGRQQLSAKMDSVKKLKLPTAALQKKADSLQQKQQSLMNEVNQKQSQLQLKVSTRYQKWTSKIDSLRNKNGVPAANAPVLESVTDKLKLPTSANTALPSKQTPKAPAINQLVPNQLSPKLPNAPSLGSNDFSTLNLSKDLQSAGGKLSLPNNAQLKQWDNQLKTVSNPLGEVKSKMGEVNNALKDPGKSAEDAAKQLKEVSTVSKEMGNAEKLLKENEAMKAAEKMKDPNALKEEAAKKAIDHFAGKEQELKQAMDQMAKYKKKLPSLESLDKMPKHLWIPRNGLKGKPFRERVRFGLNAGLKARRDTIGVDFFPNVSYNLTGRVELGGGFNYRVVWLDRSSSFQQKNPAWGFYMFGTFKTYKSVLMRLEADAFSTARFGGVGEAVKREWQWNWYLGAQTSYSISKNCKGNVQMLYNFQKRLTDSFPEQLVIRVGVQWKLGEKQNKKSKPF